MGRPSNRLYLLRTWGLTAIALVFGLWMIGYQVARGAPLFSLLIPLLLIGVVVVRIGMARRRQRLLLREPRPEPIVDYKCKTLGGAQAAHIHLLASASVATPERAGVLGQVSPTMPKTVDFGISIAK